MNHLDEGGHLNRLQVINFVHTVTALGRMMDVVEEKRGENRLSLEALSLILDREDLDLRDVSRQNGLQAEHADRLRDQLATLIVCETSEKSIKKLRPRFKKMRDEMIAHSLENPSESEINVFLVRDAIVTCGYATMLAKLLFLGENWDPKIVWRNSIQTAQAFWDRHQSGYAVFTPSQKSL